MDCMAFFHMDRRPPSSDGGVHRDLHLHRLQDHQRFVGPDLLAFADHDLPEIARQLGLDLHAPDSLTHNSGNMSTVCARNVATQKNAAVPPRCAPVSTRSKSRRPRPTKKKPSRWTPRWSNRCRTPCSR